MVFVANDSSSDISMHLDFSSVVGKDETDILIPSNDEILISMSSDSFDIVSGLDLPFPTMEEFDRMPPIPVSPQGSDKDSIEIDLPVATTSDPVVPDWTSSKKSKVFRKKSAIKEQRHAGSESERRYIRSLNNLVSSMNQSEETRLEIMRHRRLLGSLYGKLESENSLLSGHGNGATNDYQGSRSELLSITLRAIEGHQSQSFP